MNQRKRVRVNPHPQEVTIEFPILAYRGYIGAYLGDFSTNGIKKSLCL
jgi:hypothetical protein